MDAIESKYDSEDNCWIMEPIHLSNNIVSSKPSNVTRISYDDDDDDGDHRRHSAETAVYSSPVAVSARTTRSSSAESHLWFFSPKRLRRYLNEAPRYTNKKLWRKLMRYFTCTRPPSPSDPRHRDHEHPTSSRRKKQRADYYSSCDALMTNTCSSFEEQEENLKAVILYCKNTLSSPS
ncbi:hypothetical protein PanWU01x14_138260 [Parasponia andersonii]|uniref:Uncharacterized protein n=1 Tax=Parasponia andersonii TaxID=3476 RepID=A0A2P5CNC6_PARAD|nr:hypothetical protein PanWU01x14_138260 [Parasponia andersonii]